MKKYELFEYVRVWDLAISQAYSWGKKKTNFEKPCEYWMKKIIPEKVFELSAFEGKPIALKTKEGLKRVLFEGVVEDRPEVVVLFEDTGELKKVYFREVRDILLPPM